MSGVTSLHEQRLDAVISVLEENDVRSILDLGCGAGFLLTRLARMEGIERITGTDICEESLQQARIRLEPECGTLSAHIQMFEGSFTQDDVRFEGYDAAVLLETIEHIEPDQLSKLENTVLGAARQSGNNYYSKP